MCFALGIPFLVSSDGRTHLHQANHMNFNENLATSWNYHCPYQPQSSGRLRELMESFNLKPLNLPKQLDFPNLRYAFDFAEC